MAVALVAALFYGGAGGVAQAQWLFDTIDGTLLERKQGASLAVDSAGNPHVAYAKDLGAGTSLVYVAYDGDWDDLITVVPDSEFPSLALDASGMPHITFFAGNANALGYTMMGSGGSFESPVPIDTGGTPGVFNSLAIDALGTKHVAYAEGFSGELRYSVNAGSGWSTPATVIDDPATGLTGFYTSQVVNSFGSPMVAYHDLNQGDLRFASMSGGVWNPETVKAGGFFSSTGEYVSMAIDGSNVPRILFYDKGTSQFQIAEEDGGMWQFDNLPGTYAESSDYTAIAFDDIGNSHVAFVGKESTVSATKLYYATDASGSWVVETVASNAFDTSLDMVLDSSGVAHIVYTNTLEQLIYVNNTVAVPEPGSLVLALAGGGMLLGRRRRSRMA